MPREFRLEDPGEGIHEAEILDILVSEGDEIEEGDDMFVVETDKAAVEIPSPMSGQVSKIKVSKGDMVKVGEVLAVFGNAEDEADNGSGVGKDAEKKEKKADTKSERGKDTETQDSKEDRKIAKEQRMKVRKSAEDEEQGSDDREERLRDEKGRARAKGEEAPKAKRDNREPAAPESKKEESETGGHETGSDREAPDSNARNGKKARAKEKESEAGSPTPATPAVRRLAKELEVDVDDVEGSGKDGRVTRDDVRSAAGKKEKGESPTKRPRNHEARPESALPDFGKWGDVSRQQLRSVRRATAKQMATAWSQVPHAVHHDVVDITELEKLRKRYNDEAAGKSTEEAIDGATKLTPTPFVLKALATALEEQPRFNASYDVDSEELVIKDYLNIGVAVDTERGLLVPVVRDVPRKSVAEIAKELAETANALRTDGAKGDILKGGSFTYTNVGSIGGTGFWPIINHPQVAIFGSARARLELMIVGSLDTNHSEVRLMLPVCLGFDHRVIDGAEAARFVNTVKRVLEDQDRFAVLN